MIVERLYTGKSEVELPIHSLEDDRSFSEVEENAIYYVAGYVIRKLIYRHQKSSDSKSKATVSVLWEMLGEDCTSVNTLCSFDAYDYVKTWISSNDRGGLKHVSLDTFNCFKAIELITYKLISEGHSKDEIVSQTFSNENVVFHWEQISEIPEEAHSLKLLREVIDLWFTIRGFSVTNRLFEEYKRASKINIKGKKGIRKTLQ